MPVDCYDYSLKQVQQRALPVMTHHKRQVTYVGHIVAASPCMHGEAATRSNTYIVQQLKGGRQPCIPSRIMMCKLCVQFALFANKAD